MIRVPPETARFFFFFIRKVHLSFFFTGWFKNIMDVFIVLLCNCASFLMATGIIAE